MKIWKPTEKDLKKSNSRLCLVYAEAGVGKTVTGLASLPEPIACVYTEERSIQDALQVIYNVYNKMVDVTFFGPPESHDEFTELLDEHIELAKKKKFPYKSWFFDSSSYWMNTIMVRDAEKITYEARPEIEKKKPFAEYRIEWPGYHGLAARMRDLFDLFARLSNIADIPVLVTAHLIDTPKWNASLSAAPYFYGQELSRSIDYMWHLIGLLERRQDGTYPPKITFEDPVRPVLCKWTGIPIHKNKKIVFNHCDWSRILRISCGLEKVLTKTK